jgi:hypothetical protein
VWSLVAATRAPPAPIWAVIVACALFGISVAAIPTTLRFLGDRRAELRLRKWAADSRYELRSHRLVSYRRGPFATRGYWTSVFVVTVMLPTGEGKSAWLCMNNVFVWGSGAPDVHWDT